MDTTTKQILRQITQATIEDPEKGINLKRITTNTGFSRSTIQRKIRALLTIGEIRKIRIQNSDFFLLHFDDNSPVIKQACMLIRSRGIRG